MWKIGTVASMTEGWGFNITDESGRPLVAFAYETHGEAVVAARHVETAVAPPQMASIAKVFGFHNGPRDIILANTAVDAIRAK
jgi:hypothetical protein